MKTPLDNITKFKNGFLNIAKISDIIIKEMSIIGRNSQIL